MNIKHVFIFSILYSMSAFSIEMILKNGPLNSGQIYIPCTLDSITFECFYDSGAKKSHVPLKGFEHYKKVGEYQSGGAAGVGKKYDEIVIQNITIGEFSKLNHTVGRSHGNSTESFMIGSRFFKDSSLFFDFQNQEIVYFFLLGSDKTSYVLEDFDTRPLMNVKIQDSNLLGIWDTGAGLTTIDQEYVNSNSSSFTFIQDINNGTDSTGKVILLKLYKLKKFSIANVTFEDIYILGMDFTPMRKLGVPEEIKFIIGYNSIITKNWYFDFANKLWSVEEE